MNEYVSLLMGVVCAGVGGELFVRGAVGLGRWARIPPGIIGATVASFATSSPELSVSVNSALAGCPQIALGDVLGSNVVNVSLILGLALAISGIQCPRDSVKRDFPVALLVPVITGLLLLDGEISRLDGLLMLVMFVAWLVAVIIEARKQRSTMDAVPEKHGGWLVILTCIAGLAFLVGAGNLIVAGAKGIAISFGIDEFIIGATIVAVGTSVPELATVVIAKLRGHDEVGLGTILGSNIFNGIFIVAVAAIIHPITVAWSEVAVALVFGLVVLVCAYPSRSGLIGRRRSVLLLVLYTSYLATIIWWQAA
jgi:cation:H+ antiporter